MLRAITSAEFLSEAFGARWQSLLAKCPPYDLGQTHAWNSHWWNFFEKTGVAEKELFVLVDEQRDSLEAVWPLFIRKRYGIRLISWIGQAEGMITDYMMPLFASGNREKAIKDLLEFLAANPGRWDLLDLTMAHANGLFPACVKAASVYGTRQKLSWSSGIADHCSVVPLPESFDKFLAAMGSTTRSHVRQYLRAAEKANVQLVTTKGRGLVDELPALFQLNAERWQVFKKRENREFLEKVIRELPADDEATYLVSLRQADKIFAIALCFENQGICYVHSAGVIREMPSGLSPGTTMYALLARLLIERRCQRLDLSPGLEEYKLRLGAMVEPVLRFTVWHPGSAINRWHIYRGLLAFKEWANRLKSDFSSARKKKSTARTASP